MSAITIIEQAFGPNANLYTTVLQLVPAAQQEQEQQEQDFSKDFTPSQLRKAYYRQALQYHPDKQSNKSPQEKEQAKLKFQAISIAYSILSDKDRKQLYDETGELDDGDDDENGGNGFVNKQNSNAWKDYFKGIFGKVTTSDIDKFAESYKCSQEEENDVLKYYKQFRGDLNKMLECVMCSEEVDKKRWVEDYIGPAVTKGQVPDFTMKVKDTMGHVSDHDDDEDEEETVTEDDSDDNDVNRKKRKSTVVQPKSKAPTTKTKKSKKMSTEPPVSQDLIAAIRGKGGRGGGSSGGQRGLDSLLAGLEERYASNKNVGKNNKKKNKERVQDIPDEEFEKIQKRLESQRRSRKK